MQKVVLLIYALVIFQCCFCQNTDSTWFVNHYTKQEQYIPMRDGVKLFTAIYTPKDTAAKHPFLLRRTPYSCSPYGISNFMAIWHTYRMAYAREGYIFVVQDVRGRYMSEGDFVNVRPFNKNKKGWETDEASDTYDTVDWLVKNIKNNNGRLGVTGISYPGFYATQAALSGHPALVAASPQAPVTDWFIGDDFHHNGAFFLMDAFSFFPRFGTPHPGPQTKYNTGFTFTSDDNYQAYLQTGALKHFARLMGDSIPFWHEMYKHPDYDNWWQERDARRGLFRVKPAMLWVGGLFDAEDCFGAWNSFKATDKQSPETNNKIVMGPWYHGQWSNEGSFLGNIRFGTNTAAFYQDSIEIPFFNHYLLGKSKPVLNKATIFFTGENSWKRFSAWPPVNTVPVPLYLQKNGSLSFSKSAKATDGFDEYTSDPANPVPYTEAIHFKRTREYMTDDQRFASRRPDVLCYQTEVLTSALTLAGPVIADLMTSVSTTDADFVVKLIDVFPDDFRYDSTMKGNNQGYPMGGYQMLVRGEIMRGRYRNSFSSPAAFVPGKISRVRWELPDVAHTFKKGHRIMIQIQSSWFPLADRNPQKFINIYTAEDSDFQKARIRIYRDALNASKIILPVLKN